MNVLRELFEQLEVKPYRVADAIGMSRSHIYKLLNRDGIPLGTGLETLTKIANELGYTVRIKFVSKEGGEDAY